MLKIDPGAAQEQPEVSPLWHYRLEVLGFTCKQFILYDYDDFADDDALGDTVVGGNDDGSSEDDDYLVELIKFPVSLHAQDPWELIW